MNKLVLFVVSFLTLVSCNENDFTKHLETRLVNYNRARTVQEKLINDIAIEKFAIFKNDINKYKLVLLLNDDLSKELAEKYRMGLKITVLNTEKYSKNENGIKTKRYTRNLDFNPKLEIYNLNKYFIHEFEGNLKRCESLELYLYKYDNEVFNGAIGNKITIRNVGL